MKKSVTEFLQLFELLSREKEPVVKYNCYSKPSYLVNSQELARRVLSSDDYVISPHGYHQLAGHLTPFGKQALGVRSPKELKVYSDALPDCLNYNYRSQGGPTLNLSRLIGVSVLESAALNYFNLDIGDISSRLLRAIAIYEGFVAHQENFDPKKLPEDGKYQFEQAMEILQLFGQRVIQKLEADVSAESVLSTFLNATQGVSLASIWCLYEIVRRGLQDALQEAQAHQPQSQLLVHCINETLRLYPPAWVIGRTARAAQMLGEHHIPKGAFVTVCLYTLHRNGDYWPDATTFNPYRFERESGKGPLLPFSVGNRKCPAASVGFNQVRFIVSQCLSLAKWEVLDTITPMGLISLVPNQELRLVRRSA